MADAPQENPVPAPAAPAPAPVAPQPTEIDRLVKAAKEGRQEELNPDEFDKVITETGKLKEKAEQSLQTRQEMLQLKQLIDDEARDGDNETIVTGKQAELAALRGEIDAMVAAKTVDVQDVETNDPTRQKTVWESLQDGPLAPLISGGSRLFISVKKFLIQWRLLPGNKEDLDALEQQIGELFGAADLRKQVNTLLKNKNLEVRKGTQDGIAYARIQSLYSDALNQRFYRKAPDGSTLLDAANKPVLMTAAEQAAVKRQYPFKTYLAERIDEYAKTHPGTAPAGQKRVTTLMGIANDENPSNMAA